LAGILNWAVEGLVNWRCDRLRLPAAVRTATDEYRSEMDTVAQWIEERTVADPSAVMPVRDLHDDYVNWLGKGGHPFGARRFSEELERNGYASCKLTGGVRARRGLRLKPPGTLTRLTVVR
jgi:putative DNA primase/helicase